jgi:hypothetical protein
MAEFSIRVQWVRHRPTVCLSYRRTHVCLKAEPHHIKPFPLDDPAILPELDGLSHLKVSVTRSLPLLSSPRNRSAQDSCMAIRAEIRE